MCGISHLGVVSVSSCLLELVTKGIDEMAFVHWVRSYPCSLELLLQYRGMLLFVGCLDAIRVFRGEGTQGHILVWIPKLFEYLIFEVCF